MPHQYCQSCKGKGRINKYVTIKCPKCNGSGATILLGTFHMRVAHPCQNCHGHGDLTIHSSDVCMRCGGRGYFGDCDN